MRMPFLDLGVRFGNGSIELRARTASFKWQVSPLLLYSLPWHRARTEPSRKVSCQSAYCRATLFGGSREKCFAFRSRSVDGTEYVTSSGCSPLFTLLHGGHTHLACDPAAHQFRPLVRLVHNVVRHCHPVLLLLTPASTDSARSPLD